MAHSDRCDIIIPVFNKADLTRNCVLSISANTDTPFNILIIDNKSDADTVSVLSALRDNISNVSIIRNEENLGWVKAVNQGIKASSAPYVCIMNNDTIVRTKGWLAKLISAAESDGDIGLLNPRFDIKDKASDRPVVEIDFCRGYCVLIKRSVIDKIGGLDEEYGLGYYDDDDYSVRAIRAGFRCVRVNDVLVEHLRDSTFSSVFEESKRRSLHEQNKNLFYKKWGRRLRTFFIVSSVTERSGADDLLFSVARRQHIINLLNSSGPLRLPHINIREKRVPWLLARVTSDIMLYINNGKDEAKRYDLVFVNDRRLASHLGMRYKNVCYFDFQDKERVLRIIDAAAKVR